ncbi:MAG: GMC oxidoreductase [Sphingomonas sp.]
MDEASGHAGWGWDDLVPYLRDQEGNERLDNEAHGAEGPMKVSDPRYVVEMTHRFLRTMQRLGLPFRADLHDGELGGVGFVQTTTAAGRRCSAADAFLTPILKDPRLTLVTGATVSRVLFEGARATGVEYLRDGKVETAHAAREVVLAAGALVTPKLLMLSGIGPAGELARHGIALRHDLPVGRNLQDHVIVALAATADPGLGYAGEERGWRMLRNGLRYLLFRDGPVASNGSEAMAYVRVDEASPEADLQLYCVSILSPQAGAGSAHGVTLLANLLRPRSRGTVTLASADPADDPVIDLNWLSDPQDLAVLVKGLRYLRTVLGTAPLASVVRQELFPGEGVDTDEALGAMVRATAGTNYHPCGTCRMGAEDDPTAVLTPDLKVKGVDGLRVLDASMMPSIISTNLNATAMAVAAKGVDLMMR